jgi:ferrochelatase
MTFENLCKIVDGKLNNTPSVNAYEKIETKAHLIKRGDLFVGSDPKSIQEALHNGAYGILYDKETIMIDEEIAWIYVSSIKDALIKLLRFFLLTSHALFFFFNTIELAILRQIVKKEKMIFLEKDIEKNFKKILSAKSDSYFISDDKTFLAQIYPEYITYEDKENSLLQLTHQTLFLSSFTYDDVHYEDIKLPALFLPELSRVLHFIKEGALSYDIYKLHFIEHFKPLFISNNLTIQPFGHSEHAFIVEEDKEHILPALSYIKTFATWGNMLLFLPKEADIMIENETFIHYYEKLEEVKEIDVDRFNFILILANYNELSLLLEKSQHKRHPSLF